MKKRVLGMVFLLVFACAPAARAAILLDKVMAIVNKEVITWSDLYRGMEFDAVEEVKAMKAEDRRKFFKENEMLYLENLIDMRLQLQEAARLGILAGKEDVEKAVRNIKEKYAMTDEAFAETIRKEGFNFEEYKKKLAEQITISRVLEQEVKSRLLVTDKEIDDYLAEHKDEARDNEGFVIGHLFLKKSADKKQLEEKARDIRAKIAEGGNFSELARQYSDDPSARSGGDLGFIRKSDMSKDFLAVLSGMKEGSMSEPFWSDSGLHILRLNQIRSFRTPQDLREEVRQKLLNEKYRRELINWVKGLRTRAYVEIKL
jgi:peptidyl-prolyl cis-trans isomerase SurA